MKKGQGTININVIIISAISLLIVVIIAVLFIRSGDKLSDSDVKFDNKAIDESEVFMTTYNNMNMSDFDIDCQNFEFMIQSKTFPQLPKSIVIEYNYYEKEISKHIEYFAEQDIVDFYFNECVIGDISVQ